MNIGSGIRRLISRVRGAGEKKRQSAPGPVSMRFSVSVGDSPEDSFVYHVADGGSTLSVSAGAADTESRETKTFRLLPSEKEKFDEAVRSCGVSVWNGFSGDDSGKCAGDGFSASFEFPDGSIVSVLGGTAYPDGYAEFRNRITELLEYYRKRYIFERRPKTILSDDVVSFWAVFIGRGSSGSDEYDITFRKNDSSGSNINIRVREKCGFFSDIAPSDTHKEQKKLLVCARCGTLDLSLIQAVVRKYDLPAWNGFEGKDPDPDNAEWFQLSLCYASGETLDACGTLHPDGYPEVRRELLEACARITCAHGDDLYYYE